MKKISIVFLYLSIVVVACSKGNGGSDHSNGNIQPITPPVFKPLLTLPAGWKPSTTYMSSFPQGIQLFQFDSTFSGEKVKAFCLLYDSKNTTFEFKPVLSVTAKTPTVFFNEEPGVTYACINGGFFGGNQSYSLVKYNNVVSAPNIKAVNRTFNGASVPYFPTRAAYGISSSGVHSVAWIYNVGSGNNLIYSYPAPSPNQLGSAPQPVPDLSFPSGGSEWNAVSAIGGSPVLVKDKNVRITDREELIDINNSSPRPRSAIGYADNGVVVIIAVEGDNAPDYPGISLPTLASLMKSMGCVDAMNLDGGGSTSMIVAGNRTIRPSNGTERAVPTVILIKRK